MTAVTSTIISPLRGVLSNTPLHLARMCDAGCDAGFQFVTFYQPHHAHNPPQTDIHKAVSNRSTKVILVLCTLCKQEHQWLLQPILGLKKKVKVSQIAAKTILGQLLNNREKNKKCMLEAELKLLKISWWLVRPLKILLRSAWHSLG